MKIFGKKRTKKTEKMKKPTVKTERVNESFMDKVMKEVNGQLDMVIAFDTTGSMAAYIDDVRKEVSELIPRLFRANPDLRLGIVAFGDYCDMPNAKEFGNAYQCIQLTENENELVKFVKESKNTNGGDGDEFYELVIKKIVEETNWRPDSTKAVLLIADAFPHAVGYSYKEIIQNNTIDWRQEALKASKFGVQFDTLSITSATWFKELSEMTNGLNLPFYSSYKTSELVELSAMARGGERTKMYFRAQCAFFKEDGDDEMCSVSEAYCKKFDLDE
ncbi:MAG: VWA domain-containing protein [Bacteroidales bacterium]|nr:VWA domain-containing protein [Bacteroidales bacterium]